MVSSDWNECLAPCGPFDFINFINPEYSEKLSSLFSKYTGNKMTLVDVVKEIDVLLKKPVNRKQLDSYLDKHFRTCKEVPEFIQWCRENDVLFMINTTGMIGYFQRVFANNLLPQIPALSASPFIKFTPGPKDPPMILELFEIEDKPKNTENILNQFDIPGEKLIIIGDSGGDGPHFKWGAESNAFLVSSMIKPSLRSYCSEHGIHVDKNIGPAQISSETAAHDIENDFNFMEIAPAIEHFLNTDNG